MFTRILDAIQTFRVNRDFSRYEKEQLSIHEREAARRFDVGQLEREVNRIRREAELAADEKFDSQIAKLTKEEGSHWAVIKRLLSQIELFEVNYKLELQSQHEKLATLKAERQALGDAADELHQVRRGIKEELGGAYDRLSAAQHRVQAWHNQANRSPWLLGNAGKKLPKHSLFGQSFGDLEEYKSQRDSARAGISEARNALEANNARLNENRSQLDRKKAAMDAVWQEITWLKEQREKMFELKRLGISRRFLQSELSEVVLAKDRVCARLADTKAEKAEFIRAMTVRNGIGERYKSINDIRSAKLSFLADFHTPNSQETRRRTHLVQWRAR